MRISMHSVHDLCEEIESISNQKDTRIKNLNAKVKELEDFKWTDNRLAALKEERDKAIKELRNGFPITELSRKDIMDWQNEHMEKIHCVTTDHSKMRFTGAIGGNFCYQFIPTSIGTVGTCQCGQCIKRAMKDSGGDVDKFNKLLEEYDAEFTFETL